MAETTTAVAVKDNNSLELTGGSIFGDIQSFQNAQRMVKPLAESNLVPDTFKGKIGDCMIALEIAQRIGASPLAVMQNIYIVHGKPA